MIRIYAIALVIISIFLLIVGVRAWIKMFFSSEQVIRFPFLQREASFTIKKAGYYNITIHGRLLKVIPRNWMPVITNSITKDQVPVNDALLNIQKNGFSEGSTELYIFDIVSPGEYTIQLQEGSLPAFNIGRSIAEKLNLSSGSAESANSSFSISINSSRSFGQKLILFPQMILAFAGLFGFIFGLVFAISPQSWESFKNPQVISSEKPANELHPEQK